MAVLRGITNDLTGSGEFVATQRLAKPAEAKVVRGGKNGMPVTDWIVDVATPERAYAIAVEHRLQVNQSVGCSKVQGSRRADHLQSTLPSYSHSVSFVHQQKDGLQFGRKRYRFDHLRRDGPEPNRWAVSDSLLPTIGEAAKSTRAR
jgi:hypothetical protein